MAVKTVGRLFSIVTVSKKGINGTGGGLRKRFNKFGGIFKRECDSFRCGGYEECANAPGSIALAGLVR